MSQLWTADRILYIFPIAKYWILKDGENTINLLILHEQNVRNKKCCWGWFELATWQYMYTFSCDNISLSPYLGLQTSSGAAHCSPCPAGSECSNPASPTMCSGGYYSSAGLVSWIPMNHIVVIVIFFFIVNIYTMSDIEPISCSFSIGCSM